MQVKAGLKIASIAKPGIMLRYAVSGRVGIIDKNPGGKTI
jgi:hypothetical protein